MYFRYLNDILFIYTKKYRFTKSNTRIKSKEINHMYRCQRYASINWGNLGCLNTLNYA